MSFIVKGVDLPKGRRSVIIEIFPDGRCSVMELEEGECYSLEFNSKAEAVQIPKDHGRLIDENMTYIDKTIDARIFSKRPKKNKNMFWIFFYLGGMLYINCQSF